jgi:hypothetical protein
MRRGNGIELTDFVAGMVVGDAHIGRKATAAGTDDWSMTVDEILSITAAQSVTLTASLGPSVSRPRGVTAIARQAGYMAARDALADAFGVPPPPPDGGTTVIGRGPDQGISFVHVSCNAMTIRD